MDRKLRCGNLIKLGDGAAILQPEDIKLHKVSNTSTAFVRKETTFVDVIKALVLYELWCTMRYHCNKKSFL